MTEQDYIDQGRQHWQRGDISQCFAAYDAALALNPDSSAAHLKAMAMRILNFYNKEMYNP